MITNFKLFESINKSNPSKDDFIICNMTMGNTFTKQSDVDYVNTHIGKIIAKGNRNKNSEKMYMTYCHHLIQGFQGKKKK